MPEQSTEFHRRREFRCVICDKADHTLKACLRKSMITALVAREEEKAILRKMKKGCGNRGEGGLVSLVNMLNLQPFAFCKILKESRNVLSSLKPHILCLLKG